MARRRKSGLLDDFLALATRLPWWVCVGLAIAGYFLLHALALRDVAVPTGPGRTGAPLVQTFFKTIAEFAQYAVPVVLLVAAALSALKRRSSAELLGEAAASSSAAFLDGMSWREFESLVGEAFRLQGYSVAETGRGADGGVDLVLKRDGESFLVQCKQWKAFKVGVEIVRELYGVMAARGAAGGFVVTSGTFTEPAKEFASGRNIQLIDGAALHRLMQQVKAAGGGKAGAPVLAESAPARAGSESTTVPTCPVCSAAMVKRQARRGANAGGEFWGCTKYPACKGVRAIG